jgi:hypothetical protein
LEQEEIVLTKISKSKLEPLDGEIRYIHYLPENGIWDIFWSASITIDGQSHTMPNSTEARVDLRSDVQRKMVGRKDTLETLAHRRSAEIQSALRNHRLSGPTDRAQVEVKYSVLHPVVAKGSDVHYKLTQISKNLGEPSVSTTALSSLQEALAAAEVVKQELELALESYGKRDTRRTFQRCVADQLERGQAEVWVSTVTEEQLSELGGDANRLYQLLIEGKKANSLAFNETTLEAAKQRSDLFTPKQCQVLQTRKEVVEALYAAELDLVAAEEKKKAAEELLRLQMQEKANSMTIQRGAPVEIKGLKARPELNGGLGTYMGLGQGDRFIVRLDHDGKDIALKAENFVKWDYATRGPLPESHAKWTCNACTFLHGGHLAMLSRCSVCDTPKGTPAPVQQKETETKSPVDNSTKSTPSNPTKNNPKGGKVEVPSSVQSDKAHAKPVPSQNKAPVKNPSDKAPAKKKTPNPKGEKLTVAPSDANCKAQPKKVTPDNKSTEKVMEMDKDEREKLRCKHGAACAVLKRDADACRFAHTPEEIALYHPEHPSSIAFSILREDPTDESPTGVGSRGFEANLPIPSNGGGKKAKQPKKCKNGFDCQLLKKSPTACRFFHPPEEIAYHHHGNNGAPKQNGKAASVSSKPKVTKPGLCWKGLDCRKLKNSATACPFFHLPDEILAFHPNYQPVVSPPTRATPQPVPNGKDASAKHEEQSKGNASKGKGKKKPARCKNGLDCRNLQKDAFSCLFYHPPNEILVYHPNANVPQENLSVTESASRSGKTSSEGSSPSQKDISVTEREIQIASSTVGHVAERLYNIMKNSRAKVKISQNKTDSNGMSTVWVSGTEEAVAKAAAMVIESALKYHKFSTSRAEPEDISVLSGLSNEDSSKTQNRKQSTLVTPTSSSSKDEALMAFVQRHQDCLKCPPKDFYEWLKASDIVSLVELVEACKDEDFLQTEMQENGLKGFKRKPFVNAAKAAMKV